MNPFEKRKVTQAERTEILAKAREEYAAAGLMQFLIAPTTEEYLEKVADGLEVEGSQFVPPEPLSPAASAAFGRQVETETTLARIFNNRRTDANDLPPLLQKVADEQQAAELKDFLLPARRADNALNELIEKAVEKVIQKAVGPPDNRATLPVRPLPERQAFMPGLQMAVEENPDTDAAKFLRAFVSGDNEGMRAVIRGMQLEAA